MNNLTVQGRWPNVQKMSQINCLEMEAVYLTVKDFLPYLINKNALIQTENSTVTCYLNHQGGTKSLPLWHLTWKIWSLALENNLCLKSVHIGGKKNLLTDTLSRQGSVLRGLSKYRKDTQTTQRHTKTRKDGQRHAKTGKDAQRHTKTRKGSKKTFEVDKDTQRRTKTRKNLRVFARLCVSLRVFARLCVSLRNFACLCVVWVSL